MRIQVLVMGLLLALVVPTVAAQPLDINEASAADLRTLDGVGEVLAQRIIEYRRTHEGFSSVSELQEVDGIGPKTLKGVKDQVEVGE